MSAGGGPARPDSGKEAVTIVAESAVRQLVTMADALAYVEAAFRAVEREQVSVFPPLLCRGFQPSQRFGVKASTDASLGLLGMKLGCYWPNDRGLSAHGSTTILIDDETGRPYAFVGASYLTALRTAAADAVAISCLARSDSRTLAIVGAGHQAFYDLKAVGAVRQIDEVLVWDRTPARADAFVRRAGEEGAAVRTAELQEAVAAADMVVTATAASEPLVLRDWVRPGTHVSAMGADGPGKQELQVALLEAASLFAEVPEQAVRLGECQHAFASGLISLEDVQSLGGVLEKRHPGRRSSSEITLFDSSGIAAQDLGLAELALKRAREAGLAVDVRLHD